MELEKPGDGRGRGFCGARPWGHLLGINLAKRGSGAELLLWIYSSQQGSSRALGKKKKKKEQVTPESVKTNNG